MKIKKGSVAFRKLRGHQQSNGLLQYTRGFAGQGCASSLLISIASTHLHRCTSGCLAKGRDGSAFLPPPRQLPRAVLTAGHATQTSV